MKDITKKLDTRKNSVFELTSLIPQEMPGDIEIVMMKTDKQRTIYVFADWKGR